MVTHTTKAVCLRGILCAQLLAPVTSAWLLDTNYKPNLYMCICTVRLEIIIMPFPPLIRYHGITRGSNYTNHQE